MRNRFCPKAWLAAFVLSLSLVWGLTLAATQVYAAPEAPVLNLLIEDPARQLDGSYKEEISSINDQLASAGYRFSLVILPEQGEQPLDTTARQAFSKWKLGEKDILLACALREHKFCFVVGDTAAGYLTPDAQNELINNVLIPLLAKNRPGEGIVAAVQLTAQLIAKPEGLKLHMNLVEAAQPRGFLSYLSAAMPYVMIGLGVLFLFYVNYKRRKLERLQEQKLLTREEEEEIEREEEHNR